MPGLVLFNKISIWLQAQSQMKWHLSQVAGVFESSSHSIYIKIVTVESCLVKQCALAHHSKNLGKCVTRSKHTLPLKQDLKLITWTTCINKITAPTQHLFLKYARDQHFNRSPNKRNYPWNKLLRCFMYSRELCWDWVGTLVINFQFKGTVVDFFCIHVFIHWSVKATMGGWGLNGYKFWLPVIPSCSPRQVRGQVDHCQTRPSQTV